MKRIILTGASGFIGQFCSRELVARGYDVHAVSSKRRDNDSTGIVWHQADLLDSAKIPALLSEIQATHLLHLAWYAEPGKYWTAEENISWCQASLSLYRHFADNGGRRLVTAGTCAEYDWRYGYCTERITPLVPATLYGTCKHALQLVSDAFAIERGLSSAWGRIFYLYGPGEHPARLVPSVIESLIGRQPALCTHGRQIRDFMYVQDVASAFAALLDSDVKGPVNIGSGEPITIAEIAQTIAAKLSRSDLLCFGAKPAPENDAPLVLANVARLREEVGWDPKFDLNAGLEETIRWWKNKRSQ